MKKCPMAKEPGDIIIKEKKVFSKTVFHGFLFVLIIYTRIKAID